MIYKFTAEDDRFIMKLLLEGWSFNKIQKYHFRHAGQDSVAKRWYRQLRHLVPGSEYAQGMEAMRRIFADIAGDDFKTRDLLNKVVKAREESKMGHNAPQAKSILLTESSPSSSDSKCGLSLHNFGKKDQRMVQIDDSCSESGLTSSMALDKSTHAAIKHGVRAGEHSNSESVISTSISQTNIDTENTLDENLILQWAASVQSDTTPYQENITEWDDETDELSLIDFSKYNERATKPPITAKRSFMLTPVHTSEADDFLSSVAQLTNSSTARSPSASSDTTIADVPTPISVAKKTPSKIPKHHKSTATSTDVTTTLSSYPGAQIKMPGSTIIGKRIHVKEGVLEERESTTTGRDKTRKPSSASKRKATNARVKPEPPKRLKSNSTITLTSPPKSAKSLSDLRISSRGKKCMTIVDIEEDELGLLC
jgi:hypothetical protein